MSGAPKSRWADTEEDAALERQRKKEKEEKKRLKAEKQKKLEAAEAARRQSTLSSANSTLQTTNTPHYAEPDHREPPSKKRRLSPDPERKPNGVLPASLPPKLLRFPAPEWGPCRHVDNFEKLNHIEEGSYGWVSRARETATGEIVALKKLKLDFSTDGFPVTGLREIQTLMACRHPHIVELREIVMGDSMSE